MDASEGEEVFLSLEDDEPVKALPDANKKPASIPMGEPPSLEGEVVDTSVISDAAGTYSVSWPILGMDCPDCASKATRAMNQMKQVTNSTVSVTSGEVKVNVDLEIGPLFEISSVLRSLGHAPDVEHHELVGVKASAIALRNNVPVQRLNRVIRRQPGVLDVEISDDDRILVQLVVTNNQDLVEARKRGLEDVLGQAPELSEAKSNRLRPDPVSYTHLTLPTTVIV